MLISLNIEINFVNISHLLRISFTSSVSNLINIFANCNIKFNSIEFSRPLCINDSSLDDDINLFYNVNSNVIFNDEIFS